MSANTARMALSDAASLILTDVSAWHAVILPCAFTQCTRASVRSVSSVCVGGGVALVSPQSDDSCIELIVSDSVGALALGIA